MGTLLNQDMLNYPEGICHREISPHFLQCVYMYVLVDLAQHVIITPCACAKGKAIGFVCLLSVIVVVTTKIARSGDIGI